MMLSISVTLVLAVLMNVPLGLWRANLVRFSWQWFLAIHASIPVLVGIRLILGLGWTVAPLALAAAVLGQFLGTRLQDRRSRTRASQIPHDSHQAVFEQ
ncbi:MAG: hypothetical protein Q7R39_08640 [Dehalococcoidia bacterium]|nr:hypothetical protein [Dehalococcoidia bacterium]